MGGGTWHKGDHIDHAKVGTLTWGLMLQTFCMKHVAVGGNILAIGMSLSLMIQCGLHKGFCHKSFSVKPHIKTTGTVPSETFPSRVRAGFNDVVHRLVLNFITDPGIILLLKHEIDGAMQWLPVLRRDLAITVIIFIIGHVLGLRSDLMIIGSSSNQR